MLTFEGIDYFDSFHFDFSRADAERLFTAASERGMVGEGHVWIVTEQALDAVNIPTGSLGLKLIDANNETAHIQDSL